MRNAMMMQTQPTEQLCIKASKKTINMVKIPTDVSELNRNIAVWMPPIMTS